AAAAAQRVQPVDDRIARRLRRLAECARLRARVLGVGDRAAPVQLGEAFEVVGDAHGVCPLLSVTSDATLGGGRSAGPRGATNCTRRRRSVAAARRLCQSGAARTAQGSREWTVPSA